LGRLPRGRTGRRPGALKTQYPQFTQADGAGPFFSDLFGKERFIFDVSPQKITLRQETEGDFSFSVIP
jgi:hypothetical protein